MIPSETIPPRGNCGRFDAEIDADADRDLPDHLVPVTDPNHTAYCEECGFWITVGPDRTEYGHGRASNRGPDADGVRRDCPHRPNERVDP
ncbi:hypothetical protein ELS19_04085 [Halogeometricum borinquense]|uniref:Uncharacterized protein n=1 Tax=Halogeometricum borinquense TaxID=60847 RepID=A0A482T6C6_9EURY|nr:hypothetical protein [Halogeometricum borinquense]RYJ13230.1 hypothetical protein ELS19_04085 [Halogeometricum borinquense]